MNAKSIWDVAAGIVKTVETENAERYGEANYAATSGTLTGILTGLPDTPENRRYLEMIASFHPAKV